MTDNLDQYRRLLRRPPRWPYLFVAAVALAVLLGAVSGAFLFSSFGLGPGLRGMAVAVVFFFLVPALLSAESLSFIDGVPRRWTYLLSIADEAVLFLFSLVLLFADTVAEAWQLLWLAMATVFLVNLLTVSILRGRRVASNLGYAFVYPGATLAAFHVFIGQVMGIPRVAYLQHSVLFLVSAALLGLTVLLWDFLIRANVKGLPAVDVMTTFIRGDARRLSQGVETDITHQALHIDNGDALTFTVPWLHPGPAGSIGGGKLTAELIGDGTFFLHVPSYHSLDLADPAAIDRFRDPPAPDATAEEATRLVSATEGDFTVYGRRYGDTPVLYLENRSIDDYEPAVALGLKERYPGACIVDLHNQPVGLDAHRLERLDKGTDDLHAAVDAVMGVLEDAELHAYEAGWHRTDEHCALVERVEGQETCLVGIDGNDAPPQLHALEEELDYDETLVFTTDTHEKLVEVARPPGQDLDELRAAVEAADADRGPAAAGLGETVVEDVTVLGKHYEGLITTLNVMGRLVPVSLVMYYVSIVLLVL